MRRLILLVCMLGVFLTGKAVSGSLNMMSGTMTTILSTQAPTRNVIDSAWKVCVSYQIPALNYESDDIFTNAYNVSIPGMGNTHTQAQPSFPFIADRFELPEECVSVGISVYRSLQRTTDMTLAPARLLVADSKSYVFSQSNIKPIASSMIATSPSSIVKYHNITRSSDNKKILEVGLQPVQYDSRGKKVRVYYYFNYSIVCYDENGNILSTMKPTPEASSISFKTTYLILSKPEFSDACEKFATWKRQQGFNTQVLLSGNWTPSSIKESISGYYKSIDNLRYVLIVGGHSVVPSNVSTAYTDFEGNGTTSLTDYYYSCLDSDDDFERDIYIGRIPADTPQEAAAILDKIKSYESDPIDDVDFFNHGLHCSHYQIKSIPNYANLNNFVWTSEKILDFMYDRGYSIDRVYKKDSGATPTYYKNIYGGQESLPAELKDASFNWNGTATDIVNKINSGVFYVLHRDHGSTSGWGSPSFETSDLSGLTNGNKLPIVFSLNCQTGNFKSSCFASEFLKKENGGCAAIFAASNLSYSPLNDYLALGLFNSVWRGEIPGGDLLKPFETQQGYMRTEPVYTLGEILDEGMEYVLTKTGANNIYYKVTRERFHIFGDPSMMIYTDKPDYYDMSDVEITRVKKGIGSGHLTIKVHNHNPNMILGVTSKNGERQYFGKDIVFDEDVNETTRIHLYGPNYKPYYISTGVEAFSGAEVTQDVSISVYLNQINIARSWSVSYNCTVNIYDINMNLVKTVNWPADMDTISIDTSNLKAGQYVVSVMGNGKQIKSFNIKI